MNYIPVTVVVAIIGLVLAVKYLPWWGSVLLLLALVGVGKFSLGRSFRRLLLNPFRMKGAVLKGATVQVHSITPLSPTAGAGLSGNQAGSGVDDAEGGGLRQFYELNVTLTPQPASGQMTHWEPAELQLVEPGYDVSDLEGESEDSACTVLGVEVEGDDPSQSNAGYKFSGPQRLRLLLGVSEGVRELKFRYYFETFGLVSLPEQVAKAA